MEGRTDHCDKASEQGAQYASRELTVWLFPNELGEGMQAWED